MPNPLYNATAVSNTPLVPHNATVSRADIFTPQGNVDMSVAAFVTTFITHVHYSHSPFVSSHSVILCPELTVPPVTSFSMPATPSSSTTYCCSVSAKNHSSYASQSSAPANTAPAFDLNGFTEFLIIFLSYQVLFCSVPAFLKLLMTMLLDQFSYQDPDISTGDYYPSDFNMPFSSWPRYIQALNTHSQVFVVQLCNRDTMWRALDEACHDHLRCQDFDLSSTVSNSGALHEACFTLLRPSTHLSHKSTVNILLAPITEIKFTASELLQVLRTGKLGNPLSDNDNWARAHLLILSMFLLPKVSLFSYQFPFSPSSWHSLRSNCRLP